jgi:DNA-binding transcriptional LysR family regulator
MDLDRLNLFLQIVRAGSMSAAARTVHLTQPAISRNIQLLEEALGVTLFERRGRTLELTAAGRALVPRAEQLLQQERTLALDVSRCAERGYFDLRLGTIDSVATFLVPRLVAPLHRSFPELALKLSTARTALLLERVREGALDLAVVAHSGPPPDATAVKIGGYSLQFYGKRDRYPTLTEARTEADIKRFPVVEIEPPPGQAELRPPDAQAYAVASNVASVKALVLAGFGVGDLPDFMLSAEERKGLASARVPHDPHCGLYLVSSPRFDGATERRMAGAIGDALAKLLPAAPRARRATQ